jgi:peptide deformylase
MYQLRGVGLAANQLGFNINVAVIDTSTAPVPTAEEVHRRPFFAMVNPKILLGEQLVSCEEGCLSVPVSRATISRFKVVDAQYVTPEGEQVTQRYEGITAFAVQHEIDHLGGKIFFSRASLLNRDIINRKLKKLRRQGR